MRMDSIKVDRLYLKVAEQILKYIDAEEIEAEQRLPSERDLASQLGVSRPTVREALIALEITGAVEIRSGSGVYVLDGSTASSLQAPDRGPGPFEILEARRLVESEACALAAERISEESLEHLDELLEAMRLENQQETATEEADQAFHCVIAEACGNSALDTTIRWLWQLRNQSEISTHFHRRIRSEGIKPIIADHEAIVAALRQRDPDAARKAMGKHLQRVIDHLLNED